MSNKETPDSDPQHLYPPFLEKVKAVLAQATTECAKFESRFARFGMFEGYRSVERQLWLYAQGRTRPGAIVTWKKTPDHHGFGLAADCVWYDHSGHPHWDGSAELWQQFGHCVRTQGLIWGGNWPKAKDMPHCQPNPTDMKAWQAAAAAYLHTHGLSTP
jgi:hypothetical protein